jgi:hypothetical protein
VVDLTFILRPFSLGADVTRADLTGDDSTWGLFDWKSFSLVPDNRTNVHVEAWNCYKTFLIKFKITLNSLFFY